MKITRSFSKLLLAPLLLAVHPNSNAAETNLGLYEDLCLDVESLPSLGIDDEFDLVTIEHMGVSRSVFVHVPESVANSTKPMPMVMDIHGFGGCPGFQMVMTGWLGLAKANGYVYVAPLGNTDPSVSISSCWSLPGGRKIDLEYEGITSQTPECCCTLDKNYETFTDYQTLRDDIFLRKTIETLTEAGALGDDVTVDPNQVVVTGHSNGGMASFAMAAEHSDLIRGIAVFGGNSLSPFPEDYTPIPVYIVHGEKDGEMPYGETATTYGWGFDSQESVFNMVANKNGCDSKVVKESLTEEDGIVMKRTNCTNNADVTYVLLEKGGHNPYKGADLLWNDGWGARKTVADTSKMACQALFEDCVNDGRDSESGASRKGMGAAIAALFAMWMLLL